GYNVSDLNLKSFFDASQICNLNVATNVSVKGRVNGVKPVGPDETPGSATRNIKLYECNITLDTNETRRDNIERILETMSQSELIWSEGQYKLVLAYPSSDASQNSLVTATYTDKDIINSEISITWAGVQDRFNRATVKFLNEEQDFATDSVSFPPYSSTQHLSYLADDNGIENEIEYFVQGGTHRRTALAKAEELVRNSRISKGIEFELDRQALVHEQGDLIRINSASAKVFNEIFRIEEILITSDLTVQVKAVRFDWRTLAYNVTDTFVTNPKVTLPSGVPNVINLAWNAGSRVGEMSNGWLSWTNPDDDNIRRYLVYYRTVSGQYVSIGESRTNFFDIPSELNDGTDYYFMVRSEGSNGRLSPGAIILLDQMPALVPLINSNVNRAVGSNSVTLNWNYVNPQLVRRYDVYQATTNNRNLATRVASSTTNSVIVAPLSVASYYFWVDVIGDDGAVAPMSGSIFVSALTLGVKTGDFPAFQALQEYMTDSVFLQAKDGSTTGELELATYNDGDVNVSTARISADAILLDGSVTAEKLNVNSL
ncbi:MAG: phage tail protein, partial [Acinetobacter sp.]|uniref:phage tail protein n=1 Tax=Acinetobacter sp. TaxID=472 RepID=UPI00391A098F